MLFSIRHRARNSDIALRLHSTSAIAHIICVYPQRSYAVLSDDRKDETRPILVVASTYTQYNRNLTICTRRATHLSISSQKQETWEASAETRRTIGLPSATDIRRDPSFQFVQSQCRFQKAQFAVMALKSNQCRDYSAAAILNVDIDNSKRKWMEGRTRPQKPPWSFHICRTADPACVYVSDKRRRQIQELIESSSRRRKRTRRRSGRGCARRQSNGIRISRPIDL